MRAYVGQVGYAGLRRFVAEDALPDVAVQDLVRGWASATATVFRAVLDEDAAEAIHRELARARPDAACGLLLNRARELVLLRPGDEALRA